MTYSNEDILDALKEIVNIGMGKSAEAMNELIGEHIGLSVPDITVIHKDELATHLSSYQSNNFSDVTLEFGGQLHGKVKLIFPLSSAIKLANLFTDNEYDEAINDIVYLRADTLSEIGNIVINSLMSVFSSEFGIEFMYELPQYCENSIDSIGSIHETDLIICHTRFTVETLHVSGELILFFSIDHFEQFKKIIYQYLLQNE